MPNRKQDRRNGKQLAKALALPSARRRAEGARLLREWHAEANRRADELKLPAVWELERSKGPLAWALDPSGELSAELSRVCAEALARVAGRHLVGSSRPLADRSRLQGRPSDGPRT